MLQHISAQPPPIGSRVKVYFTHDSLTVEDATGRASWADCVPLSDVVFETEIASPTGVALRLVARGNILAIARGDDPSEFLEAIRLVRWSGGVVKFYWDRDKPEECPYAGARLACIAIHTKVVEVVDPVPKAASALL